MKISFVCIPSGYGGSEVHTLGIALAMRARGHEVTILEVGSKLYADKIDQESSGIVIKSIPISGPIQELTTRQWIKSLPRESVDCYVLVKGAVTIGSTSLDLALRLRSRRLVSIEHSTPSEIPRGDARKYFGILPRLGLWRRRQKRRVRRRQFWPTKIVCVCGKAKEILVREYGFDARKISVVFNGVDTSRFAVRPGARANVLSEWGIADDSVVFGAVGRLSGEKNYSLAIRALNAAAKSVNDRQLVLVIIGDGPDRENLQSLARELGVESNVHMPGFSTDPALLYSGIDFYLVTSETEGMPLALLESMASGCVPIACGVGGIPEVIEDGVSGYVVPVGSVSDLAGKMSVASAMEPSRRKAMSANAQRRVERGFNSVKQCESLVEVLLGSDCGISSSRNAARAQGKK